MGKIIFILLSTLVLFSCQEVIDITPAKGDIKVIIQGNLYADSIAYVVVTKSIDYLNNAKPPGISNAVVTLSDDNGNSEVLIWSPVKQRFETVAMKGVIGDTYTLKVDLEGNSYSASSELLYLEPVDSIIAVKEDAPFREEGYYMKLYGTVSTNIDKFYLFKGYSNDSLLSGINEIHYGDNTMITGQLNGYDMGYKCKPNATAKLEIYSLTVPAYKFYSAAGLQLINDGGFFSTPPANVPSMFSNGAVGLFQCSAVQVLTTYVTEQ